MKRHKSVEAENTSASDMLTQPVWLDRGGIGGSADRMRAALSGRTPDRVPFAPTLYLDHACFACGQRFEEVLINPARAPEFMLDAALRYGSDHVRNFPGPESSWYEQKVVREEDGSLFQYDRRTGHREGEYDLAGGGTLQRLEKPAPVRTLDDVRALPVLTTEEYLQRGFLKDVAVGIQKAHAHNLFAVGVCAGQTLNFMVQKMGTPEAALLSFYDEPNLARALINKAVAISVEISRAFIKLGVDAVLFGDSYASGSVISPQMYEDFCAPAYRELAQEIHRHGVLCYKHCCGNYNPFLDLVPSTGIDGMDGIDPTCGMSVRHTKEKVGNQVTVMGGISCLTLLNGTPEQVYEEASRCVKEGKPGGRYVLGSACAVARHTPPANLLAAAKAASDHGRYP